MTALLPIIIIVIGIAAGVGGGLALRPTITASTEGVECAEGDHGCEVAEDDHAESSHGAESNANVSYVKLNKQFVVPVVKEGLVRALVVLTISLEVEPSLETEIYDKEPKLRDALLSVMFLHANSGGFEGQFTGGEVMKDLRGSMLDAARELFGSDVHQVLVTNILRQDV